MKNVLEFKDEIDLEIVYCCLTSGSTSLAAPAANVLQMIQLAMFTTPDDLVQTFPLFNQIVPLYSDQAVAIAEILTYLSKKSGQKQYRDLSIIAASTNFGISGAKDMILASARYDITIKAYQQFVLDDNVDIELHQIKNSGSRVILGIMEPIEFASVINSSMKIGLAGEGYVWLCYTGCASPYTFLPGVKDFMVGLIGINQSGFKGEAFQDFSNQIEEINKLDNRTSNALSTSLEVQYHYDGVFFLATAIQKMIEEGGFTENGKLIDKYRFNEILRNTTIIGVTGEVRLTPKGVRYPIYDIVNLQSPNDTEFTIMGTWNLTDGLILNDDFVFFDQTTNIPDIDIREPFQYWSCNNKKEEVDWTGKTVKLESPNGNHPNANIDPSYYCDNFIDCENISDESSDNCSANYINLFIVFGVINGVLIALAILFAILTIIFGFIFRRRRVISASPLFLLIIAISCIVGYSSIFAWYGKPNKVGCGFQSWLLGLSVMSMISALCAKTFRIWRIFKSPFNRNVITDCELLILWLLIMAPSILILILWTIISTPTAHMEMIDENEHFVCATGGFTGPPGGYIFFAIFVVYSAIILLFGAFLSIVTRDVPELFNESKIISISIYHLVFLSLLIIPVVIALSNINPYIGWIIRSGGILYAFTATLWIQFLPKIFGLIFIDRFKNHSKKTKSLQQLEGTGTNSSDIFSNIPEAHSYND